MREWEVWLNGKLVADYKIRTYADNKCHKLIMKHGLNITDDVLYIRNVVTGEIIEYL